MQKKYISPEICNILILTGGSDAFNVIDTFLQSAKKRKILSNYANIWVVCGKYNNRFERLSNDYKEYGQITFMKNILNIKKYMEKADVAISAGGTTIYELCAVGTSVIAYTIADNQIESVKSLEEQKNLVYVGDVRENKDFAEKAIDMLVKGMQSYDVRKELSMSMQKAVDGKGASRIVKGILKSNSTI